MGSTFNPQILVDKLAKLNNSQASIETLSHWCIFHMNKAKQVVETWNRQFHSSPREQRLTFLYLANDILQNSRRKGSEFVGEFWRVLPGALRDVIDNGDDFGRNAAFRLIAIWEERKVFGSRAQNLKDEFVRRHVENSYRNVKPPQLKLRPSAGNSMEKIVSGYQVIYGGQIDEDVTLRKCRTAISCIEKGDGENSAGSNSGQVPGSAFVEELQGQLAVLRECIDQLTTIESSRSNLVSYLRIALQEEEFKLDEVRNQIQVARIQSEHATCMRQLLVNSDSGQSKTEQSLKEINTFMAPSSFTGDQQAPAIYAQQQGPYSEKPDHIEEDQRKSAAAAMAAKLTASTSSAQMLSYVLSSLAPEGVIGNSGKEYSSAYPPPEKRSKLEGDQSSYVPQPTPPPPPPPYSNPEPIRHNVSATDEQSTGNDPPPPSSSPPPLPSVSQYPMQSYMQNAEPLTSMHYSYKSQQSLSSMPDYPTVAPVNNNPQFAQPPVNTYLGFQASEGSYYSQPSSMPVVPISRQ